MSLQRGYHNNDLFRDPFFRDPFFGGHRYHRHPSNDIWSNANSGPSGRQLAVDISEQGNTYLVETEVPGFKKENIDIKVGDGGRSLTVSGKQVLQSTTPGTGTSNEGKLNIRSPLSYLKSATDGFFD